MIQAAMTRAVIQDFDTDHLTDRPFVAQTPVTQQQPRFRQPLFQVRILASFQTPVRSHRLHLPLISTYMMKARLLNQE